MSTTRRTFLGSAGTLALYGCASRLDHVCTICTDRSALREVDPARLPVLRADALEEARELFAWLMSRGWLALFETEIDPMSPVDARLFQRGRIPPKGFEDCAGVRAIQPGHPQLSLLYHALASADVVLPHDGGSSAARYPGVEHLDALESFIYRLDPDPASAGPETALAVLAYEYRPAARTPHGKHADLVFSRTGIGRVGEVAWSYDPKRRAFDSRPRSPAEDRKIAVLPARFGLFLVEKLSVEAAEAECTYAGVPSDVDRVQNVLRPLRKVCSGDPVLAGSELRFGEYHYTDKLRRLFHSLEDDDYRSRRCAAPGPIEASSLDYELDRPPFVRSSADLNSAERPLVELHPVGSSVLLASRPDRLVREARLPNGHLVRFKVPRANAHNRRYRTLKLWDRRGRESWGAVMEVFFRRSRAISLRAPRNAPMFVNIRHEVVIDDHGEHTKLREPKGTDVGGYEAVAFEDDICNGCVTVLAGHTPLPLEVLPAYSIVTAPDFLPLVDIGDLQSYDSHFLEGNVTQASVVRRPADPGIWHPGGQKRAFPTRRSGFDVDAGDTVTAVVSQPPEDHLPCTSSEGVVRRPGLDAQSSLPDAASGVFYPGWDVTYAGEDQAQFLTTSTLGAPFAEDLKLCAAANGMWPVAAPDAARTFQGSLTYPLRHRGSPTAIPLLDAELGFHPKSTAATVHGRPDTPGWDGEHGPFLTVDSTRRLVVSYADIETVDYVSNVMHGRFHPEVLRELRSDELVERMDALAASIHQIDSPQRQVRQTRYWLISVERVKSWASERPKAWGIPPELFPPESLDPCVHPAGADQRGFLLVFALTRGERDPAGDGRRLLRACHEIAVCGTARASDGRVRVAALRWRKWCGWKRVKGSA
jgi:hypothetical protein